MKKFFVLIAMLAGLFAAPAVAAEKGRWLEVKEQTFSYTKKRGADYWTRQWYRNQARKGRHYRYHVYRNGRVVVNKRYRATKRRAVKRRAAKRRVAAYRAPAKKKVRRRISSRMLAPGRGAGRVTAKVSLSKQRMNVYRGGKLIYSWPVSTGRKGYSTPRGTWSIHRMHTEYYSKKYDLAPMPYAMFYSGGFAIHGTNSIKNLGRRASHGCVRLHPSNAAQLFAMVRKSGGTVKVTN